MVQERRPTGLGQGRPMTRVRGDEDVRLVTGGPVVVETEKKIE